MQSKSDTIMRAVVFFFATVSWNPGQPAKGDPMQPIPFTTMANLLTNPTFDNANNWTWLNDMFWQAGEARYQESGAGGEDSVKQIIIELNDSTTYRLEFEITAEGLAGGNEIVCGFRNDASWASEDTVGVYTWNATFVTPLDKNFLMQRKPIAAGGWAMMDNVSCYPLDMVPLLTYNLNSGPGTRYETWKIDGTYSMSRYSNRRDATKILVKYKPADLVL